MKPLLIWICGLTTLFSTICYAHDLTPEQYVELANSLKEGNRFTDEQIAQLKTFTVDERLGLFEIYGNPAITLEDTRLRLQRAGADKQGYFDAKCIPIPEALLDLKGDKNIQNRLVVSNQGSPTYCWFLHPEGESVSETLKKFLATKGIPTEPYYLGKGQLTSSRTCLIIPKDGGPRYYLKSSIDGKLGPFENDKLVQLELVERSLLVAESSNRAMTADKKRDFQEQSLKTGVPLQDTFGAVLKEANLGFSVRPLNQLSLHPGHYLIPAFSAIETTIGKKLAGLNQADKDWEQADLYWMKHYAEPLGKVVAEILVTQGVMSVNPHSQNYLLEFDEHNRPTGRVVFRDAVDSELFTPCTQEGLREAWNKYFGSKHLREELNIVFQIFHGSGIPDWGEMRRTRVLAELKSTEETLNAELNTLRNELDELKQDQEDTNKLTDKKDIITKHQRKLKTIRQKLGNIDKHLPRVIRQDYLREDWQAAYYESFTKRFSELTGIPKTALNEPRIELYTRHTKGHFYRPATDSPHWNKWLAACHCLQGADSLKNGLQCTDVLDCYHEKRTYSKNNCRCSEINKLLFHKNTLEGEKACPKTPDQNEPCLETQIPEIIKPTKKTIDFMRSIGSDPGMAP